MADRVTMMVAALLTAWVGPAWAQVSEPEAALARAEALVSQVEQRYRALDSFKLTFRQHYRSATFGAEEETRGTLVVAGSRMLWLYDVPRGQRGALDGDRYWLIVPEDRQVIVREIAPGGADPLAQLLSGRADIRHTFLVSPVPEASSSAGVVVELTPREHREDLERAVLEIDVREVAVRRLEVVDPLGNRMIFELGAPVRAPAPPPGAFKLTIPSGFAVTKE